MAYSYDPELASVVPLLSNVDLTDVAAARASVDVMAGGFSTEFNEFLDIGDHDVPGYEWNSLVTVRMFRARRASGAIPALLYIHGGGFVAGSVSAEHDNAATLASTLGIAVVSVEYRLAPEHPFPAGLHDCVAALNWLSQHAGDLGVDPSRVGVYGRSAGGGLAAALALFIRDHSGPPICFQFLDIPVLDDRLETQSMRRFVDTPEWDRLSAKLSWAYYLGPAGSDEVSPYAAPSRAHDLTGLPPAYVLTMEFDPLRDEGILYALALLGAGVSVELHSYPGTFHGSSKVTTAQVSRRMADEQMRVLARALAAAAAD
ncbi:MAG: alpha/beta hydrolase [Acidimicrobiales bacterium]